MQTQKIWDKIDVANYTCNMGDNVLVECTSYYEGGIVVKDGTECREYIELSYGVEPYRSGENATDEPERYIVTEMFYWGLQVEKSNKHHDVGEWIDENYDHSGMPDGRIYSTIGEAVYSMRRLSAFDESGLWDEVSRTMYYGLDRVRMDHT